MGKGLLNPDKNPFYMDKDQITRRFLVVGQENGRFAFPPFSLLGFPGLLGLSIILWRYQGFGVEPQAGLEPASQA